MGSTPAAVFPTLADVAGASALLSLADSSPSPPRPPPLPTLSDEVSSFSCYSGASSSYSGASARSCVSDSAQRGRAADPLRVLSVVAALRRINPRVLVKATGALVQGEAAKKRKGVWIQTDEEDESENEGCSAVASEGSAITGGASAGSTATSGIYRRPPQASDGGTKLTRTAASILKWLSRPKAAPATETAIRAAVGDSMRTSNALRWLVKRGGLRRAGTGGRMDPFVYMVAG